MRGTARWSNSSTSRSSSVAAPRAGTLCLTFDNMGRAREVGLGLASGPDPDEPSLAVGYPRLLALLDELGLRGTFFIEGWNALHHPDRVLDLVRRGHEVGLHGWVHENFAALDRTQAEQVMHDGTKAMRGIGVDVRGFRAPGAFRGAHTVDLLRALGYRYDSSTELRQEDETDDFAGALEPCLLAPGLAHVPWRYAMVDSIQYLRNVAAAPTPAELAARWRAMIDRAAEARCTMALVIHAYVSGVDDARFAAVRDVLTYARRRGGIEICTARSLAERALSAV
jgi:peptidoglycan/xylan/chitin deacetylase (PgdA/CDA1 family)